MDFGKGVNYKHQNKSIFNVIELLNGPKWIISLNKKSINLGMQTYLKVV